MARRAAPPQFLMGAVAFQRKPTPQWSEACHTPPRAPKPAGHAPQMYAKGASIDSGGGSSECLPRTVVRWSTRRPAAVDASCAPRAARGAVRHCEVVEEEQVVLAVGVERAVRRLLSVARRREEARARPAREVAVRALPTRAAPPAASRAGVPPRGPAAGVRARRSARRPGPSPRGRGGGLAGMRRGGGCPPGALGRSASARRRLHSPPQKVSSSLRAAGRRPLLSGAAARLAEVDKERPAACARVEVDERVDGAGVGVDSRQPAPRLPLRCGQGVKGGGEVGHLGPAADAGHGLRVEEHVREAPRRSKLPSACHCGPTRTTPCSSRFDSRRISQCAAAAWQVCSAASPPKYSLTARSAVPGRDWFRNTR
mmetsp:Transcript_32737/g.104922  ORF Transcript_32737/g.104922 Transcript_32737/m.104922 type:complete len:370 (+) Transcript_32737:407-1516(+)